MTLISRSFCPLAQIVARGLGFPELPILLLPHPIGDQYPDRIRRKGIEAIPECARLLTTPAEELIREFSVKKFERPDHVVSHHGTRNSL